MTDQQALNILMRELRGIVVAWDASPDGQIGVARMNDARIALTKVQDAMAAPATRSMTLDEAATIEEAKRAWQGGIVRPVGQVIVK